MPTSRRSTLRLLLLAFLGLIASSVFGQQEKVITPTSTTVLFDGKDLSRFYTWLRGHRYGDPDQVFRVVTLDGAPVIRASGQHFGGIVTRERFSNYRLTLDFRWGKATWEPRKEKARDAGILMHCQGPDGNYAADLNGAWMRSVEYQFIEGGTGDMLLVGGYDRPQGTRILTHMTAPVRAVPMTDGKGQVYFWDPKGAPTSLRGGRVNWFGRHPQATGRLGFRGAGDLEKPVGEWNSVEAICDGDTVAFFLNGVQVNGGTRSSLREGRILFQSEGSEVFYRNIQLNPLKK